MTWKRFPYYWHFLKGNPPIDPHNEHVMQTFDSSLVVPLNKLLKATGCASDLRRCNDAIGLSKLMYTQVNAKWTPF